MILVKMGMRPADALGKSDPIRPFVTGGLGLGKHLTFIDNWFTSDFGIKWMFSMFDRQRGTQDAC